MQIHQNKPTFFTIIDRHYMTLWDKNDLPTIRNWQKSIRDYKKMIQDAVKKNVSQDYITQLEKEKKELSDEFFELMNRSWDDRRTNLQVEPHHVSKVDDIMTYKGIGKFCRLIVLQDQDSFTNVAVGTSGGANVFMPFNDQLVSEEADIDFEANGFFDAAGMSVRYGGTFGENLPTETYSESLVRNKPNFNDPGMIVMCINNFADDPINHDFGDTGFTCAGLIEFKIIAD